MVGISKVKNDIKISGIIGLSIFIITALFNPLEVALFAAAVVWFITYYIISGKASEDAKKHNERVRKEQKIQWKEYHKELGRQRAKRDKR